MFNEKISFCGNAALAVARSLAHSGRLHARAWLTACIAETKPDGATNLLFEIGDGLGRGGVNEQWESGLLVKEVYELQVEEDTRLVLYYFADLNDNPCYGIVWENRFTGGELTYWAFGRQWAAILNSWK